MLFKSPSDDKLHFDIVDSRVNGRDNLHLHLLAKNLREYQSLLRLSRWYLL